MNKKKKALIYLVAVIISFLIIPEVILRTISADHFLWLGYVTSFGGMISPLLSVLIFMGLFSIFLAIATVFLVGEIYRRATRTKRKES